MADTRRLPPPRQRPGSTDTKSVVYGFLQRRWPEPATTKEIVAAVPRSQSATYAAVAQLVTDGTLRRRRKVVSIAPYRRR